MRISRRKQVGGDGWLLVILVAAAFIITTLYFREGASGPLTSLRIALHSAVSPISQAGEFATRPLRSVSSWTSNLTVSRDELETLREQNAELRQRLADLEEARLENERLRELVGFVQARELDVVGARVIGKPMTSWDEVIVIDRGSADGVKVGMPVLAPRGLIGVVVESASNSARVRLITDPRSGVASILQGTRAEGISRGSIEGDLTLEFVSRETTVTVGGVVLTSGMGGVFPKGLLIGEVSEVQMGAADMFPAIRVRPSAGIDGLEEVVVLIAAPAGLPEVGGE